ncbi:MAG TPA: acylphosphatase [Candidatus Saccharimonadales bacterium]|nr:acylphosphatase [Candidatus Saccharimonadales bacterium]
MAKQQMQILYEGRVQGVGFRYTTKALACGFEVTGTVRNMNDGRVELLAEGEREELEAFLESIRESELGHFIRQEKLTWGEAKNCFRGFEIVR